MISTAGDIADFYERLFIGDFLGPEMLSAMLILVPLEGKEDPPSFSLLSQNDPQVIASSNVAESNESRSRNLRQELARYT